MFFKPEESAEVLIIYLEKKSSFMLEEQLSKQIQSTQNIFDFQHENLLHLLSEFHDILVIVLEFIEVLELTFYTCHFNITEVQDKTLNPTRYHSAAIR